MIINTVAIYQRFLFLLLLQDKKTFATFAIANKKGAIAQLVEQRTENPCVPGSIPGGTTQTKVKSLILIGLAFFLLAPLYVVVTIIGLFPKNMP